MIKKIKGIVHGTTIELEGETGLEDGRSVEVTLRSRDLPGPPPGWKAELAGSAAGLLEPHWTEEDDRILQEIQNDRKRDLSRKLSE
ncbi:MAG: hypothetical protein KC944_16130 [Candidatus Omnitrophica bacterium]|nr:hypothetical protein [Candidatus Omnitrophota bacterium]MCA9424227.1 hypothetical protein [Candidatus Omnitrophota bacterium]